MSETQACEVPIVELAAAVPEILVAKWIDGEYSSHSAPVGKYIHHLLRDLAAERERADMAKAEGIREGMRRAAGIAKQQNDEHAKNLSMGKGTWPQSDYIRDEIWHQWEGQERASRWIADAILKEAGE